MKNLLIAFILLVAQPVLAAMSVDKIVLYLEDGPNARDDVVVSNPDEETLYVQTEIFRVDNPGMENEQRVRVVNPDEFKLLVSPSKAVLAPGERKRFRLMALDRNLDEEKVYRVTFKPVVGKIKAEQTALKILVAYQALVFVQPDDGEYKVDLVEDGNVYRLTNSGNINVEVVEVRHCLSEGECEKLEVSGRLYAGTSIQVADMPENGELEVLLRGQTSERVRFPLDS
ncbi:fimbria/pilus periplasmic chaperone [Microbulbifer sp. OS29]|uniref:Fimbria/pilus periplasmic chaperone n=1 Tax=Microbulbifer okhotskensis TaxID=2926617 RepID=A0A9X2EQ32_9GAMM|nr:fimbria/pilus periplasmic chaperone [Microbulbifer okhotskensis]MCO1335695.1 fimbria/pilus periplasmic chaperone [Microbulbifer okhotskensis]